MARTSCEGCEHLESEYPDDQYCYMFKDRPDVCCLNMPDKKLKRIAKRVIEGNMSLPDAIKDV